MQISGSIGVTILKNNDKIIILLADDHSNSSYCDNEGFKNHQSIKDYLEKELKFYNLFLGPILLIEYVYLVLSYCLVSKNLYQLHVETNLFYFYLN